MLIDPKMRGAGYLQRHPTPAHPGGHRPEKGQQAHCRAVNEMLNRYQLFKDYSVRDMTGF